MIKKYSEILIDICREIDFEYDVLMDLSEKNKENNDRIIKFLAYDGKVSVR